MGGDSSGAPKSENTTFGKKDTRTHRRVGEARAQPDMKIKHTTLLALTLTGLLSAPALQAGESYTKQMQEPAAEAMGHFYWAVFGGVNLQQSADIDDADTILGSFDRSLDSDTGWFAGLKFGYDFESNSPVSAALELEAFYSHVDSEINSNRGVFDVRTNGDIHAGALMFNALVKFRPVWHLRPYLGAGVGVGYLERDDDRSSIKVNGVRVASRNSDGGDDFTFAYQGIAGLDWWVTDRWTLFTEYKAVVFHDAVGLENYLNHMVGVGIRVKF